jgi:hypothetical protein
MLKQWPKLGLRGTNSDYDFTSSLLLSDRVKQEAKDIHTMRPQD